MNVVYLLHDCAGTFDELPLGEAISGAELQSSSFLDQVDASVAQLLNPGLNLVANLEASRSFQSCKYLSMYVYVYVYLSISIRILAHIYTYHIQYVCKSLADIKM